MDKKNPTTRALRRQQTADAVASLASGVLHDLNNILYVLLGNAELGLKKAGPDAPVLKHFNEIMKAARRGMGIGDRIQTFRQALTSSQVGADLSEVLEESKLLLDALLPSSVEAVVHADVAGLRLEIESADFHQILLNLCQNSSRALSDQGSIDIKVGLVTPGPSDSFSPCLRVEVSDRGCGIEAGDLPRVFSADFTTKPVTGVAGLGLAVVHGIVTEAGGHIAIESEVGFGTTVVISLPSLARDEATAK